MRYVYFLKPVGMYGPVKIGTSETPMNRLHTLMAWSPFKLELMATTPGSWKLEHKLHCRFARSHLHAEWFEPDTDLMVGIAALRAGKSVEEAFDLSQNQGSIRKKINRFVDPATRKHMSIVHRIRWAWRKAEKELGCELTLPADVWAVYHLDGDSVTPADLRRVDDFIANATAQCIPRYKPKLVSAA